MKCPGYASCRRINPAGSVAAFVPPARFIGRTYVARGQHAQVGPESNLHQRWPRHQSKLPLPWHSAAVDYRRATCYAPVMENDVRDSRTTGGVQAVDHALALLLAFQDGAALLGPTELSQRLKLSKSAVHAILVSLERQGFVYRDVGAGKYGLGPRLAQLGRLWQEDLATRSLARPALEWLARES